MVSRRLWRIECDGARRSRLDPRDQGRIAGIDEAGRQAAGKPNYLVGRAQQQRASASDVMRPPSKDATTACPSTRANSNPVGLHSVGTGKILCSALSLSRRRSTYRIVFHLLFLLLLCSFYHRHHFPCFPSFELRLNRDISLLFPSMFDVCRAR